MYGTGHMQRRTCWQAPVSTHLKWVSPRTTLLACVFTRACVLLSFVRALVHRVVQNEGSVMKQNSVQDSESLKSWAKIPDSK